jgi:hypothetical protein
MAIDKSPLPTIPLPKSKDTERNVSPSSNGPRNPRGVERAACKAFASIDQQMGRIANARATPVNYRDRKAGRPRGHRCDITQGMGERLAMVLDFERGNQGISVGRRRAARHRGGQIRRRRVSLAAPMSPPNGQDFGFTMRGLFESPVRWKAGRMQFDHPIRSARASGTIDISWRLPIVWLRRA